MDDTPSKIIVGTGRFVLSGSLAFYGEIKRIERELFDNGIESVSPVSPYLPLDLKEDQISESRRIEAFKHMRRIKDPRTRGLIVVNPRKHGIQAYIGPSTFSEICVAFAHSKPILILYGFPEIFEQELTEWKAIALGGDMSMCLQIARGIASRRESRQFLLF